MNTYISVDDIKYQLANLRQLTFEVTDACNLKCQYCAYGEFYNDYDQRRNTVINSSVALKLIDYLVDYWKSGYNMSAVRNVYISFYGGEPLLNMNFIRMVVGYIEKLDCPQRTFTFSMTTNAILLEKYMDFLVEHNFVLLISLDGNERNTSYRVHKTGAPAYEDIIRNVNALRGKYPEYFLKNVNFNAVLHNRNTVSEICRFFETNYQKIPTIGELNNVGIRPDKVDLFRKTYRNSHESLHQAENYEEIEERMFMKSATYQSVTNFVHQYSGFVFRNYTDLLLGKVQKTIPTGTCIPFAKRMFVTVNGKIMPCERIGQQFSLGKVTSNGVELDLEAIVEKYNGYYAKMEPQCSKCYKVTYCIQCVFNLNNLESNPVCYGFTSKQGFEAYRKVQMDFLRQHPEAYYRIMEKVIIE